MTDMFLERRFAEPLTAGTVLDMAKVGSGCFSIHRVAWHGSLLSSDGRRMVCWFAGQDAESPRTALRQLGVDTAALWAGTVHDAPHGADGWKSSGVIVTRRFDEPVSLDAIQAIEDAGAWCLEAHRVRFLRTLFSRDRRRMLCLYQAPDAESVRLAQQQARLPVEDVWSYQFVDPTGMAAN